MYSFLLAMGMFFIEYPKFTCSMTIPRALLDRLAAAGGDKQLVWNHLLKERTHQSGIGRNISELIHIHFESIYLLQLCFIRNSWEILTQMWLPSSVLLLDLAPGLYLCLKEDLWTANLAFQLVEARLI